MVDYAAWASVELLTVEQAAHLWAGVDPSSASDPLRPAQQKSAVAPKIQQISGAIVSGALNANTSTNPLSSIGQHNGTLVRRADLITYALAIGEKPAFLFDTMLGEDRKAVSGQPNRPPKNLGGRPAQYDWNLFTLEIIRIAATPDGLPETQAELAEIMRKWFIDLFDNHPADTTLADRIRTIYQYVKQPRKPAAR